MTYAYVGITTENLTPSAGPGARLATVDHGALIVTVKGGSPADAAGLRGGIRKPTSRAERCRPEET